jgi:cytolysin (calcineurin-like family phosphatase)
MLKAYQRFHFFFVAFVCLYGCKGTGKAFSFYVFSDTHCLDSLDRYQVLDSMITEANTLHLKDFPDSLNYLRKLKPRGLLICGDLTDNAQPEQWTQFTSLFGLNGEQRLNMPVYENYGNHDGDTTGIVRTAIRERNKNRNKLTAISENGMHYSWDWGNYHFVSLGSYPSYQWDSTCKWCHYFKSSFREPQNSLGFLKADLKKHVKGQKKVIMYIHYGWDSFSQLWWTEEEQQKFYDVIKDYKVAAIFTGHNHATGYMKWRGIDVYSAGSPQSGRKTGSFQYVQATKDSMYVIERRFDRWGSQSLKRSTR